MADADYPRMTLSVVKTTPTTVWIDTRATQWLQGAVPIAWGERIFRITESSTFKPSFGHSVDSWHTVTAKSNYGTKGYQRGGFLKGEWYLYCVRGTSSNGPGPWATTKFKMGDVPPPPKAPTIGTVTASSVSLSPVQNGNGGWPIDSFQHSYQAKTGGWKLAAVKDKEVEELLSYEQYQFRSRVHSIAGWSDWGAPSPWVLTKPNSLVVHNNVWKHAVAYVKVDGVWVKPISYARGKQEWTLTGPMSQ